MGFLASFRSEQVLSQLIAEPDPGEGLLATRAVWRYARAVAFAALGRVDEAKAEQRAFDLGRSDLLRIQLREAQLADARVLAVDARLGYERARVQYRAALGESR